MAKQFIIRVIFDLIFLALFNVFFFTISGKENNTAVWISYGFVHFSYLMFMLTRFMIRKGKNVAVFSFSLYAISLIYFFAELIAGTVFILVSPESYKAALLVQISLAAIYGVMLTLHMLANERTADAEERRQPQITYIKDASITLKKLVENINDREAKKSVEKLYDAIYSSPVKSHPDLAELENRILSSVNELERAVSAGNRDGIVLIASTMQSLINQRNDCLKLLH